ncbi:MAG TPA: multiheme c-type cytochrome [Myxococcaceae bacterium]|nr:multiheme c-type cytochrome [Myxococcaceae bacterium]
MRNRAPLATLGALLGVVTPAFGATVFVSSDLRGYLGPCGCSENMRGGLPRAAHQLKEARRLGGNVLYLDAGDSLFSSARLSPEAVPQESRKARALAEGMKLMGLNARALGERDDARGAAFRKSLGLPEIAAGSGRTFDVDGRRVAVIAAQTPTQLFAAAKRARDQGAHFVLALFHATLEQAQKAAEAPELGADLVVASHAEGEFGGENNRLLRLRVPVVQVQSKGRSLLRVDLSFGPERGPLELVTTAADVEREVKALEERMSLLDRQINAPGLPEQARTLRREKLAELVQRREHLLATPPPSFEGRNAFSLRFVPLEASLPSDPAAAAVVTTYDRDVGKLNLAWAAKHGKDCRPPGKGEAAFVGNARCRACHADAFPVWEKSLHARGYETLVERGKQFHLDCIGCHVTGFNRPGGVCRVDRVAGREDVGCEGCHGPGSLHSSTPSAKNVSLGNTEQACTGCHDRENSPHFDFREYLPQILGPGHGARRAVNGPR